MEMIKTDGLNRRQWLKLSVSSLVGIFSTSLFGRGISNLNDQNIISNHQNLSNQKESTMVLKHVVFHSPGPQWKTGVDFREQPGVMEHVQHYAKLHGDNKLFMGGPFIDADSGGMMVAAEGVSRQEIEAYAALDPAVTSGLLTFVVKTWYIAMAEKESQE
ncbi:MAG: hypothetical protein H6629_18090 [Calditrichae bacterium]|nr:hypothetical protein [Calditrichia bacterium]